MSSSAIHICNTTSAQLWWCQYIFYSCGSPFLPVGGDLSFSTDKDITLNSWKVLVTDVNNESNQSLQLIVRLDNIFQSKRPSDFTTCTEYFSKLTLEARYIQCISQSHLWTMQFYLWHKGGMYVNHQPLFNGEKLANPFYWSMLLINR